MNKYSKVKQLKGLTSGWTQDYKTSKRTYDNLPSNWKEEDAKKTPKQRTEDFLRYSFEGNKKLVKIALTGGEGTDIFAVDGDGNNAVMLAAMSGKKEVLDYVSSLDGIEINKPNQNGITPLIFVVQRNRVDLAGVLLERGVDPDFTDAYSQSPMFYATMENNSSMIDFLSCYVDNIVASVNLRNREGRTPLMVACFDKHRQEAMLKLISLGADIDAKDNNGATAIYHAINSNNSAMIDILIKKGANINLCLNSGISPLMLAAKKGNREVVRVLISKGADVMHKDDQGRLASDIADVFGKTECGQILRKAERIYSSDLSQKEKSDMLSEFGRHNRVMNSCQK